MEVYPQVTFWAPPQIYWNRISVGKVWKHAYLEAPPQMVLSILFLDTY